MRGREGWDRVWVLSVLGGRDCRAVDTGACFRLSAAIDSVGLSSAPLRALRDLRPFPMRAMRPRDASSTSSTERRPSPSLITGPSVPLTPTQRRDRQSRRPTAALMGWAHESHRLRVRDHKRSR